MSGLKNKIGCRRDSQANIVEGESSIIEGTFMDVNITPGAHGYFLVTPAPVVAMNISDTSRNDCGEQSENL